VEENLGPKVTEPVTGADASTDGLPRCPTCGSARYHRTRRTRLEHFLSRPAMARCEKCGLRFPYPEHSDGSSGPVELEAVAAPVLQPSEERRSPEMAEESSKAEVTKPVADADASNGELPRCPTCGSARYHRTRRTGLERFLSRPPMARCETCGLRFPYPGHHEGSSGSVELEEEAPVLRPSEERRSPEMAEESSRAEVIKPVTDADASNDELPRCPTCGSTRYYRTHRNRLERFLSRPPMARCEKCEARFPYPRQHEG
jgi:uncharacterized protein (DUF983 family)